jgi:protein TonB
MNTQYGNDPGPRRVGLVFALALHAVVITAILSHPPTRAAIATAMPIMVSLITSAPVSTPQTSPRPLPVHPILEQAKPAESPPLVATTSEASAQFVAPIQPIRDLPPIDTALRPADYAPSVATAPLLLPRLDAAYLQNPPPVYPPLARRMGEQGRVFLRVRVAADGLAQQVELKTSSGSPRLDHAALDTVKRWRFVPARQGDQAVAAWVVVPISFSLEG